MTLRILLSHNPEDLEAYYGRALPELEALGVEVVPNPTDHDLSTPELIEAAAGCHVIVAHRATPGEAAVFATLPDLVAFLRTAVDISTIDLGAATSAGVIVGHADKSFVPSTAELALGLLLDASRNIASSTEDYRAHREPPQRPGRQIRGMTAGIIGYGAIGSYLADLLAGAGLDVVVSDPDVTDVGGHGRASLEDLLATSDVVFPLVASTSETHHLIDAAAIAAMRPGSILVNVSRGEIVDESAVTAALDGGHLAAFACDVGSAPDQRPDPTLAARPDVVATPHLGGLTPENADAQARSSVEQVAAILAGDVPPRLANPDARSRLESWWAHR
ncbi:MAG: NAD(P)-dependent oxidoreductase [Actinomycetota bacterium]